MPTTDWKDLKLNKQLLQAIDEAGYEHPTDIQRRAIPLILGGQQVIGIAQTGTGKTAAYLLPAIMKIKYAQGTAPRVLALAPTKELVVQIAKQATLLSRYTDLRVAALYGGVGPSEQIKKLQLGADVVVATPGRMMEIYLRQELVVKQLQCLVIDEADRMMDMGFRPQLRKIFEIIPARRQNLLFSATFPPKVEELSMDFLTFPVKVEITPQATPAAPIAQHLYLLPNLKTKLNLLAYFLANEHFHRVIIFARTKETADGVAHFIERKKLGTVRAVHSNKGQNSRLNALLSFQEGALRCLVCTDVAARGIDIADVSHVINLDTPHLPEDYVHRIGRTGRAFRAGTAITLATPAEIYYVRKIEKLIRSKIPTTPLPEVVEIAPTPFAESQSIAREIDRQRRREDPTFQGAFHERKRKK